MHDASAASFRLVELPIKALSHYVVLPLSGYDEIRGGATERRKTEDLIIALGQGAVLPPIMVVIPPFFPETKPVEVFDGYHRTTAYAARGLERIKAWELILAPDAPGAQRSPKDFKSRASI